MSVVKKVVLATVAILLVVSFFVPSPRWPGQRYEVTINNEQSAIIDGKYFRSEKEIYTIPNTVEWTRFCGKTGKCLEMPTAKIERDHKFTAEMWLTPTTIKMSE